MHAAGGGTTLSQTLLPPGPFPPHPTRTRKANARRWSRMAEIVPLYRAVPRLSRGGRPCHVTGATCAALLDLADAAGDVEEDEREGLLLRGERRGRAASGERRTGARARVSGDVHVAEHDLAAAAVGRVLERRREL